MPKYEKHESYGQASFSRISGGSGRLYGTSIQHSETITLSIKKSEIKRDLCRYWYFAHDEIIEVEMSQSQFAELITSMNMGSGVPCTIRRLNGKKIELPPQENVKDRLVKEFQNDIDRNMEMSLELIKKAQEMLQQKKPMTKDQKKEFSGILYSIRQELEDNMNFVLKSFNEQMDNSVKEAKGEVEAFVENKIRGAGLEHLMNEAQVSLEDERPIQEIDFEEEIYGG